MDAGRLSRAAAWFPVVGVVVGGVAAGVRLLAGEVVPSDAATVLALAAAVVLTGALHEDGLADSADALGAHTTRDRRLDILRDPRVGTFGVLAVVLVLLFALTLLAPLDGRDFARAAVVGHALSRWSAVAQSRFLLAARPDGLGALLRPTTPTAVAATIVTVGLAVAIAGPAAGGTAIAVAVALTAGGGLLALRVLGGTTGDTMGAVAKLVEVGAYAALVAVW